MNPEELKQIAVLKGVRHDVLAHLAAVLEMLDFSDGQTVFQEGDPGDSMYFILHGRIRIEKRAQAARAVNKTLAVLEPGDYFGEMALFEEKPRSASAVAAGDTRILRLSKSAFDDLHQSNNVAGMGVLFAMIRTSSERIRRLSTEVIVYDEVGKAVGDAGDLQALLDAILQQLFWGTGADWGFLLLKSQFSEQLELRSQANLNLTPSQLEAVSKGQGFLATILQNPQDQLVASFETEEPFKSCARLGLETPSLLVSPIRLEGQLLGLIVIGGQERDQFDLNALNLTRGVARQAAQAILNARHREEQLARSRHSQRFVRF